MNLMERKLVGQRYARILNWIYLNSIRNPDYKTVLIQRIEN